MSTSRNAPCPCGSGNKFKRCCGMVGSTDDADATGEQVTVVASRRSLLIPMALVAVAIGLGVGVGTLRDSAGDGLAVGFALTLGVLIYLMARNPPEGTGTEGGAAINYGMGSKRRQSRGSNRPQNRRQRRQK
jgi:hypothetical protein